MKTKLMHSYLVTNGFNYSRRDSLLAVSDYNYLYKDIVFEDYDANGEKIVSKIGDQTKMRWTTSGKYCIYVKDTNVIIDIGQLPSLTDNYNQNENNTIKNLLDSNEVMDDLTKLNEIIVKAIKKRNSLEIKWKLFIFNIKKFWFTKIIEQQLPNEKSKNI